MTTDDITTPAEEEAPVIPAPEGGEEAPVETPVEGGEEASEGTPREGGEEAPPKPGEIKYTGKVEKRINRLTRDKHEAEREAAYWRGKAEGGGAQTPAPGAEPQSTFAESEPQPENYESEADYMKALGPWSVRKERHDIDAVSKASEATAAVAEIRKEFNRKVDDSNIREKHPDFDEVLTDSGGIFYNDLMEEMVMTSNYTAEIAYHLASNPGEVDRIGQMGPVQAAKTIAGLEAQFTPKPTKRTVTDAPAPITPVDGGGVQPTTDISKLKMDDFAAKRNKEVNY